MRYWAYLGAKLVATGFALRFLWYGFTRVLPAPALHLGRSFTYDLIWTMAAGIFFLISCGAVYLCFLEQRYRCRVCLRRLRMPISTGSWGHVLQLGTPRVEYICPFGHGTLKVAVMQISGREPPDWKANQDIWKELAAAGGSRK